MKCFIASAFDHDDVDAIYDRCIIPTLRKLSVTPLRVDRVEHNEDIDKKIFELLDSADFVIADLTYARPSVYYEAGYAAGKSKPVIYIAKGDHFKARNDDPFGNFRVHFDLQMRNIISWTSSDSKFSDRLLERIRLVLRPLEQANKSRQKLDAERSDFKSKPLTSRLHILRATSIDLLRARSFQMTPIYSEIINGKENSAAAYLKRVDNKRIQVVCIVANSSTSKKQIDRYSKISLDMVIPDYSSYSLHETHFFIASLDPIPPSRISEALPDYYQLNDVTFVSDENNIRKGDRKYIHLFDGIKSVSEYETVLRKVIEEMGFAKGL